MQKGGITFLDKIFLASILLIINSFVVNVELNSKTFLSFLPKKLERLKEKM